MNVDTETSSKDHALEMNFFEPSILDLVDVGDGLAAVVKQAYLAHQLPVRPMGLMADFNTCHALLTLNFVGITQSYVNDKYLDKICEVKKFITKFVSQTS